MAIEGFDAATVARVVEESGVPLSSVYHYYGSKDGVLVAVMARGAKRFFDDLPEPTERLGTPTEHLRAVMSNAASALERHPNFLRLLLVFALQPPTAGDGEVAAVVQGVRATALKRLRAQLGLAFGEDPRRRPIDDLARFALAAIDGAFVASRNDPNIALARILDPLPAALVAARPRKREP
jgi:AcrR family transcriptional regulator